MELLSSYRCFDGEQRFYQHDSSIIGLPMKFGIYLPPQALVGQSCSALFYLAGLTCSEETFPIKAHAQQVAAQLGLILVSPDTSPRGEGVAQGDSWDLGLGAGFYLDAIQAPWADHYNMASYICNDLYTLIKQPFNIRNTSIMGHSMGGHGALTLAWKHPHLFSSVSAIAPIAAPIDCAWGQKAFSHYLGNDQTLWAAHDATRLIATNGKCFDSVLIDQGLNDQFLNQLSTDQLETVCLEVKQPLTLRRHAGYDHGYYFIQTVIGDHLRFHAQAASKFV